MKIGLSLAGGGVKGAAHIGVLKAFEESNIEFEYISGTSSGSIVATLYACGYSADEIYKLFKKYCNEIKYVDYKNIIKLIYGLIIKRKIIIDGLNSGNKLENIIRKACKDKNIYNINQIEKNLIVPAVDLHNGKIYMFSSKKYKKKNTGINYRNTLSDEIEYIYNMKIEKVVRASCSYPGVFSPMKYEDTQLLDGGIRENVPWKELKEIEVDKVISVIFQNEIKEKRNCVDIIEVISNSLEILSHELSNYELQGADDLIKIKTKKISLLDSSKIDMLYELGYNKAKKYIAQNIECFK